MNVKSSLGNIQLTNEPGQCDLQCCYGASYCKLRNTNRKIIILYRAMDLDGGK